MWILLAVWQLPLLAAANRLLPAEFRRGNSHEFFFQSNRPLIVPPIQHLPPNHKLIPLDLELELRRQTESLATLCRTLSENANVYIENQGPFRRTVPCKTVLMRHFLENNKPPITLPPRPVGTINIRTKLPPPRQSPPVTSTTERPKRVQYINMFQTTSNESGESTTQQVVTSAESYETDDIVENEVTAVSSTIPPRVLKSNTNVEKLKIALRNYRIRLSSTTTTTSAPTTRTEDHSASGSAPRHTHLITFKRDDHKVPPSNRTFSERRPLNDSQKRFKLTTAHVAYILIGSCCGASVFSLIVVAATMRSKKQDRFPHRYTIKKCHVSPGRNKTSQKPGCLCEMWSFGDTKFGDPKSLYFRRLPFGTASSLSAGRPVGTHAAPPTIPAPEGEESIHCTCLVHVNSRGDAQRHAQRAQKEAAEDDPALAAVFLSTNRDCLV